MQSAAFSGVKFGAILFAFASKTEHQVTVFVLISAYAPKSTHPCHFRKSCVIYFMDIIKIYTVTAALPSVMVCHTYISHIHSIVLYIVECKCTVNVVYM